MFVKSSLTIAEAAEFWVSQFNEIEQEILVRLMKYEPDKLHEVTVPGVGDAVYVYRADAHGEIIEHDKDSDDYRIRLTGDAKIYARVSDFEVERESFFPMWSAMWSFGNGYDERWLKNGGEIEAMSNLGFRIYEPEDFGYYFGIDGAGYDFYEAHWIPLYKIRGLLWHKPEEGETK